MEKYFEKKIKTFYSDNGGEYIALAHFLSINGILHLTPPPHTPEHNGFSERRHLHIVETGLALLSNASIPLNYWTYAFAVAVYLINHMPTTTQSSPYENIFFSPKLFKTQNIWMFILSLVATVCHKQIRAKI